MAVSAACFAWVIAEQIRRFDPVVAVFISLALIVAVGKIADYRRRR